MTGQSGFDQAIALRTAVFVEEQGVPASLERDWRDAEAVHALARVGAQVVATGRLVVEERSGRIGRMAVARELRGRGLGLAILRLLMAQARRLGLDAVHLHAQCHAEAFYAREGFRRSGEVFLEAGIEHVEMKKRLSR